MHIFQGSYEASTDLAPTDRVQASLWWPLLQQQEVDSNVPGHTTDTEDPGAAVALPQVTRGSPRRCPLTLEWLPQPCQLLGHASLQSREWRGRAQPLAALIPDLLPS